MKQQELDRVMGDAALDYLEKGWAIFPVSRASDSLTGYCKSLSGKFPTKLRYYRSPIVCKSQFMPETFSNCGIGIVSGKVSGLIVIDIDGQTGLDSAAKLGLPPTRTVKTHYGVHLYYSYPDSVSFVPSSPGTLAEGIDIKGENGFVNAPPTRHPEGGHYHWLNPGVPLASLPSSVMEKILQLPHRPLWKFYRRYIFQKYVRFPLNAIIGR